MLCADWEWQLYLVSALCWPGVTVLFGGCYALTGYGSCLSANLFWPQSGNLLALLVDAWKVVFIKYSDAWLWKLTKRNWGICLNITKPFWWLFKSEKCFKKLYFLLLSLCTIRVDGGCEWSVVVRVSRWNSERDFKKLESFLSAANLLLVGSKWCRLERPVWGFTLYMCSVFKVCLGQPLKMVLS